MSEETELLVAVRERALARRLLISHRQDSRRDHEWSGGFPDLVIASPLGHGVLFAELKSSGGDLSREQRWWQLALAASGVPWVLWRPADLASGEIDARLQFLAGQ